jgi:predicted  nucleic acid-binding Zn-ribbon protein
MIEVEDQKIKFEIEEASLHKAFDRERYAAEIKGMKKEEMREALLNEAHIRYNAQCELADERVAFKNAKNALHKAQDDAEKWLQVARDLSEIVRRTLRGWPCP